jgi:hypothetical protein
MVAEFRHNEKKINEIAVDSEAELKIDVFVMKKLVFTSAAIRSIAWLDRIMRAARLACHFGRKRTAIWQA